MEELCRDARCAATDSCSARLNSRTGAAAGDGVAGPKPQDRSAQPCWGPFVYGGDGMKALAVEIHEGWLEATRYLNMDHLKEHKKQTLRALAA